MVVKGKTVGKYGGNWRMGTTGVSDGALYTRTFAYEQLVRWNPEWTAVIPNIAEKFEVNKDATEFTFYHPQGPEVVGWQALHRRGCHLHLR